jgi:sporadic carbohydrate cluster protein (TIGR04323 family)
MPPSNRTGYRGYICARMGMDRSVPQNIQQLVMRDYCAKRGMAYLLAAVEYRMSGCTMVLDAVLNECEHLDGVVMYSVYLLPAQREKRLRMYRRLLDAGCSLHFAAENIAVESREDAMRLEESQAVMAVMRGQQAAELAYLKQWDAAHA